jgi:tight adherence protein C
MIASAGFRPRRVLPVLLGIKILLAVAIPSAALLYAEAADFPANQTLLLTAVALLFGLLGPAWIITLARRRYTAALRQGVPDALDLLTVCGDAGVELDGALEHVSLVIARTNPATAVALRKLLGDMRLLPDWHDAFRHFAEQTGIESARRISLTVTISVRYGTPLNPALRALATDLRRDRMAALEAKAARLPILLILPLLLFVVPALVVILTCPATQRLLTILPHPWAG